jgi:tetratricopeptide (TPR) repeat protein
VRGPDPKSAFDYLEPALDHLEQSYRNEQALELADRALETLEGERRFDILMRKAGRLDLLGRREEQKRALKEALPLATDSTRRAAVLRALGRHATVVAQHEAALEHLNAAIEIARDANNRQEEMEAVGALGVLHFYAGHYGEMRGQFERQLELAQALGDVHAEATATGRIGIGFWLDGEVENALPHFERSLELSREVGNREREGVALMNLGEITTLLGEAERARRAAEEGRAVCRSIGAQLNEGEALLYLGALEEQEGNRDKAAVCYRTALDLCRRIFNHYAASRCLVRMGRLFLAMGRNTEALRHLEEGLAVARENVIPEALVLGEAYLALMARSDTQEARRQFAEHGAKLEYQHQLEANFVLWKAAGDAALLERAHTMLTHLRDHAPEEYRESMIENVPLHKEIMEAWRDR